MIAYADVVAAFDAEAGDVSSLTDSPSKVLWFNQAQGRLGVYNGSRAVVEWAEGDTTAPLPEGLVRVHATEYHPDNDACDRWRILNLRELEYISNGRDFTEGALADGSLLLRYDAEWPAVTEDDDSLLTNAQDTACVYYALSRFWRLIASNRAYYKRYATLVGANAFSVAEAQGEADRYLQDFNDARDELPSDTPALFYEED